MTREDEINLVMLAYNANEITTSRGKELLGLESVQEFSIERNKWLKDRDASVLVDILSFIDTMECTDDSDRMFKFGHNHATKKIRRKVEEIKGH